MPRGGVSNCQEACLEEGARELGSPAYWPSEFCAQELREGGAGVSPLSPVPFLLFLRRNDGAELPFITCVLGLSSFCLSEWKLPKQHCRGPGRKYVPNDAFCTKQAQYPAGSMKSRQGRDAGSSHWKKRRQTAEGPARPRDEMGQSARKRLPGSR